MPKRYSQFTENAWIRKCDNCDHIQEDKDRPVYGEELSVAYTERKCKKCKSAALDYGCENYVNEDYL